ncbi:tRNA (adenosine(37)-N6)-dimethylallyltransferase MiaA [Candidatus Collierbacteria bacterium CG10_big_fil_rev_8_21_14_0_10_44_9]|uniref:tRNA dimethylallyltransferase n=1 Tax=Candidatus Collierbacteria bacterium CG10_big_fil_rev_8_21_14_0_10_44_9 TaxID=1974535 RepID=A0A2H0VLA5_9BACT|nr:MAG: tRNA (adenosine(37)-N6)-dimethylallyltransferase MiaA [Candidatus Collierbacteria bacterium CG10_big_fil_rev_8_21_14_0_10_44_9]
MNKLLAIVGPTGTGKTARAIKESLKQPSIIISADSRQVYRGMDIVTGKDHPKGIKIYGVDIVDPDESCSVAVWYDCVIPHIQSGWKEGKQVIVVGGTGLYVKALTDGIPTMQVPINQPLRDELSSLSITELQEKLNKLDSTKFTHMNHSDQYNSRRLIRAIEITGHPERSRRISCDYQLIGLKYFDDSNHRSKVKERVFDRLTKGAVTETKSLVEKYAKNLPSMSAIGYRSLINFIENKCTKQEMIDSWVEGELAYSKRQMTWFRKQPVIWYDIDIYGNTKD